jgi:hypothetical protein
MKSLLHITFSPEEIVLLDWFFRDRKNAIKICIENGFLQKLRKL